MRERFKVYIFANGMVVVFRGDDDAPDPKIAQLTGRFSLWRWLRIWWAIR